MPSVINLLPESTANQIAAGEVVQRPASVVKELLENSIDAGATNVKLYIKNGGSTSIQVDDNGCGMNAFDARMCWERHATSKITTAQDLYNLHTLGFRGEALASIASVSEVEMKTKCDQEEVGTLIEIGGGEVLTQESVAATRGTSIKVKNLFYNLPARKNFLKSISVESKHIFQELQRIALAYPAVAFEYYNQDKSVLKLAAGDLKHRIETLFNCKPEELIKTTEKTDIVDITGYIGNTKLAKRTRGNQFLFANGRFIKDPYLNHAISSGYGNLLEEKQYPFYVLFLEVDPAKIDVNIHPTKHEVKFQDSRYMYTLVNSVIKKCLGSFFNIPIIQDVFVNSPTRLPQNPFQNTSQNKQFNPFGPTKTKVKTDWEKLDELLNTAINQQSQPVTKPLEYKAETIEVKDVYQVYGSYLMANVSNQLWLINQHRAHAQVLYERYLQKNTIASQQLLFPRALELSNADFQIFSDLREEINSLGFDVNEFGKNTIIVNGLPGELSKEDGADMIIEILDDFKINEQNPSISKKDALLFAAAKNAAIKAGTVLSVEEQKTLLTDLLACKNKTHDYNGNDIVVKLTKDTLERYFQ